MGETASVPTGYLGFGIPEEIRAALLGIFPVHPDMEAVCHHVTLCLGGSGGIPGTTAEVVVTGRFTDGVNDVLAVTVDGASRRPDGEIYHVTHGLNRAEGGRARLSAAVLDTVAAMHGEVALASFREPVPIGRLVLVAYAAELTPKTRLPRVRPARGADEVTTEELPSGLVREESANGARTRTRWLDPFGKVVAVTVVDASGNMLVNRGADGCDGGSAAAIAAWEPTRPPSP